MTNFNFTFQPGTSSEQIIGFEMAGRIWSQYLQDNAAFDIHVVATDSLPPTIIGGAIPEFGATNITDIEAALSQDTTSAYDTNAVDSIGTLLSPSGGSQYSAIFNDVKSPSSGLAITNANAKALGWQGTSEPNEIDGYIVFNDLSKSTYSWDYDFSRASRASSQEVDFLGMALHELGHIMGFTSGVDIIESADGPAGLNNTSLFDLFRYSERSAELDAIEMTAGEDAYFSLDGGQTSLASLSTGYIEGTDMTGGFQASHWKYQPAESDNRSLLFRNITRDSSSKSLFSTLFPTVSTLFPTASALTDLTLSTVGTLTSPVINLVSQLGQRIISPDTDISQLPESVGVMDEVAVPGTRPDISELDLLALDVIGYDISDNASSSINYSALLKETEIALSEDLGVDINSLYNVLNLDPLVQDKQADLEDLFERRRSQRRSRSFLFFQEMNSTAPDDKAQTLESQSVELTELSNLFNYQSALSDSEQIDQRKPDIVSENTNVDVTQPTEAHSTIEPQSSLSFRNGLGQVDESSVDSLIGYKYNRSQPSPLARASRWNRSGQNREFSTELGIFERNPQSDQSSDSLVDQLSEPVYSQLGSTSLKTHTSYGSDDSPWNKNAIEALGVESVEQMLSSWWR